MLREASRYPDVLQIFFIIGGLLGILATVLIKIYRGIFLGVLVCWEN